MGVSRRGFAGDPVHQPGPAGALALPALLRLLIVHVALRVVHVVSRPRLLLLRHQLQAATDGGRCEEQQIQSTTMKCLLQIYIHFLKNTSF